MRRLIITALVTLMLTACQSWFEQIRVFDIEQGNILKSSQVQRLHRGQSKTNVRKLLGSPVLNNSHDPNHWVYIYTLQKPHQALIRKVVHVYFKHGRVIRIKRQNV